MTPETGSFDNLPSHIPRKESPKRLGGGFCSFYFDIKIRLKNKSGNQKLMCDLEINVDIP
jgi:hypothetical protein